MITLFLISLITFIAYNSFVILTFGVPASVSDSSYLLKERNLSSLFTFFCWLTALPLLIYWIEVLQTDWDMLPFAACGALMFVGAAPEFKDKSMERKVHVTAAIICLLASYIWSSLYRNIILTVLCIVPSAVLYFEFIRVKNKIFWIEIIAFINIYVQLMLLMK